MTNPFFLVILSPSNLRHTAPRQPYQYLNPSSQPPEAQLAPKGKCRISKRNNFRTAVGRRAAQRSVKEKTCLAGKSIAVTHLKIATATYFANTLMRVSAISLKSSAEFARIQSVKRTECVVLENCSKLPDKSLNKSKSKFAPSTSVFQESFLKGYLGW